MTAPSQPGFTLQRRGARHVILIFAMQLCASATWAQPANLKLFRLDTAWWNRSPEDEQNAFVSGYLDCRQISHQTKASTLEWRTFISDYSARHHTPIPSVIEIGIRTIKPALMGKGSEKWYGPHGYLDGGYWGSGPARQGWENTQRGFVEGYLACKLRSTTLSAHLVDRYVQMLDRHYVDTAREHDKIANVLESLIPKNNAAPAQ